MKNDTIIRIKKKLGILPRYGTLLGTINPYRPLTPEEMEEMMFGDKGFLHGMEIPVAIEQEKDRAFFLMLEMNELQGAV